jgi:hypothetical protein
LSSGSRRQGPPLAAPCAGGPKSAAEFGGAFALGTGRGKSVTGPLGVTGAVVIDPPPDEELLPNDGVLASSSTGIGTMLPTAWPASWFGALWFGALGGPNPERFGVPHPSPETMRTSAPRTAIGCRFVRCFLNESPREADRAARRRCRSSFTDLPESLPSFSVCRQHRQSGPGIFAESQIRLRLQPERLMTFHAQKKRPIASARRSCPTGTTTTESRSHSMLSSPRKHAKKDEMAGLPDTKER